MQQPTTGIEIKAGFFFLAFILWLFKPTIVIDGTPHPGSWGTQFFPTGPGRHEVRVFFRYLFLKEAGAAQTVEEVRDGEVVRLVYRAPWLVFLAGKLRHAA